MLAALIVFLSAQSQPGAVAARGEQVDGGTFVVRIGKAIAGREEFSVHRTSAGFEIRSHSMAEGGNTGFVSLRGTLRTNRDWRPLSGRFEASVGGRPTILELAGPPSALKVTTRIEGERPSTVRAKRRVDIVVVQNLLAHLLPLCAHAGPEVRKLMAFPGAPVTIYPPVFGEFELRAPVPGSPREKPVRLAQVSVDFEPDLRIELVCDGQRLVSLRQPRNDLDAWRTGYERVMGRGLPRY